MPADAPHRRLEARDGAVDGRRLDRILGLGADGEGAQPGGHRGGGTDARPQAASVAHTQRIAHHAAGAAEFGGHRIGDEIGEFGEVGFTEQHRAGFAQARDQGGFVGWNEAGQGPGAGRGGRAVGGKYIVLEQIGHTMQGAAAASGRQFRIGATGLFQCQGGNAAYAIEAVLAATLATILAGDARQIPAGRLYGSHGARCDGGADGARRARAEEGCHIGRVRVGMRIHVRRCCVKPGS
jgi:hypothetical protein